MYSMDGDMSLTILMLKIMSEDGHIWILGPCSFRVISLSNL